MKSVFKSLFLMITVLSLVMSMVCKLFQHQILDLLTT